MLQSRALMAMAVSSALATSSVFSLTSAVRFSSSKSLSRLVCPAEILKKSVFVRGNGALNCRSIKDSQTRSLRIYSTRASAVDVKTSEGAAAQPTMDEIVPAVIVGAGRVGAALEKMGGGKDFIVRRGEPIPADRPGPIIVCTRNDALAGVVDATPENRREDLVFIQNGMLDPFLESNGLASATQVLVYFAIAKFGDPPTDGITDLNPEGLTVASGKWASAIAARLKSAGLSCRVLDAEEFKKPQLEKLIWICAFMLVGARHPGATVGDVESKYHDELASLVQELAAAAESVKSINFDAGVVERLCAYARSVAHFPTAVKEFEWRNGFFYSISEHSLASGQTDPCPLHTAWLKEVGAIKL